MANFSYACLGEMACPLRGQAEVEFALSLREIHTESNSFLHVARKLKVRGVLWSSSLKDKYMQRSWLKKEEFLVF